MREETWRGIVELVEACRTRVEEINRSVSDVIETEVAFFKPLSLNPPRLGCAELVFLRSVFWLNGLLHEAGGRPIRFCCRQSQFGDAEGESTTFLENMTALRTHAGHNLDGTSDKDKLTEFAVMQWYQQNARAKPPMSDDKWNDCTRALLGGGGELLERIKTFVLQLKTMANAELLKAELARSVTNHVSPFAFDDIVDIVASDLGRTEINLRKFRADHLSKWMASLDKLHEGYDFTTEARSLVERSFLENPERPPVSGLDIIQGLKIPQGREVGRLLAIANRLFEGGTKDKQAILEQLRLDYEATSAESGEGK